jgi:hypothetical protein
MIKISYYDEDIDSLIVSSIEDNEKVRKSFIFGDFIISTTGKGKVVSLEIREFSHFLEEVGLDINQIKDNLDDMHLIVKPRKELLFIGVGVEGKKPIIKQIPVMNIPLQCMNN